MPARGWTVIGELVSMPIKYTRPADVETVTRERPLLSTGKGGYIVIDEQLLSLWKLADNRYLDDILASFHLEGGTPDSVRAGLACLAEGGLLDRGGYPRRESTPVENSSSEMVSAIVPITSQKEQDWLGDCIQSLFSQTHKNIEVLVMDNATDFGLGEWLETNHSRAKRVRLAKKSPFAVALNQGVRHARGSHFLLLNPDLKLEPDAVAHMVREAEKDPKCAAVAAKLKFWWAPSFLNGLGNRVRDFGWGTDNGIGHLDLGQFDHWEEVPSACFAATLVPRRAWEQVGAIDEGFQLYYEDTEWCYRARLLGFSIRVAAGAEILHIFGGWVRDPGQTSGLTPWKIRNAAYGRMRFAAKILGKESIRRFFRNYSSEDIRNFHSAVKKLHLAEAAAYLRAWWTFLIHSREIHRQRKMLQNQRQSPDGLLFGPEEAMPPLLVWRDLPELTWETVERVYLPMILEKRTRPLPEFETS